MSTTRLSSKGQVILPKSLRDERNWEPGTEFVILSTAEGVLLKPLKPFPPTRIQDLVGCTGYRGRRISIREMDKAIGKALRKRR